METEKKNRGKTREQTGGKISHDFFESLWEESSTRAKTVADAARGPILILNGDLRVVAANEPFLRTFRVELKDIENKAVHELGNGEWNIPALRKLLEDIPLKNTFFKGFEVAREFPFIGEKVMLLNARPINTGHPKENIALKFFPPLILLSIEDVTEMMDVADMLTVHTNRFQAEMTRRMQSLEVRLGKLEREVKRLKDEL